MRCFFVSDLHGKLDRYELLFDLIAREKPHAVFIGGDLLPGGYGRAIDGNEFMENILKKGIISARKVCGDIRFFIIFGNDDPRVYEENLIRMDSEGLIDYVHGRAVEFNDIHVAGYSYVPPSPFMLKDWEKYDVSRFTDVGAVSPEEGIRTVEVPPENAKYDTIDGDLKELAKLSNPKNTIYLFHSPPYETCLDRLDNEGMFVDHAPVDAHVGSIAIRRFLEREGPFLTLHGHIHESVRITGRWRERFAASHVFGASHDGPGLALVRFSTGNLGDASRDIITHL